MTGMLNCNLRGIFFLNAHLSSYHFDIIIIVCCLNALHIISQRFACIWAALCVLERCGITDICKNNIQAIVIYFDLIFSICFGFVILKYDKIQHHQHLCLSANPLIIGVAEVKSKPG